MERERNENMRSKRDEEAQAQLDIWKYILGFAEMAVVKCAIELGIADVLESHEGSVSLPELVSSLGCSSSALFRIMRFLTHRGIFKEEIPTTSTASIRYVQTPLSRLLTRNGERSMAALLLLENSPEMLAPWHQLSAQVLENGNPPFVAAHGCDLWLYTAKNPAHGKLFNDAMACDARMAVSAMVKDCPEVFDGIKRLVDVGGGDGTALRNLVKAFPWINGINFDLPHVVSVAQDCDGVEHVGGDMFHSVPQGDTVFIMKVLHDWEDDECIKILKKCREAIPKEKGKLIIADAVIEESGSAQEKKQNNIGLFLDMVMLAHTSTGKERTLKEWACILTAAGFKHYNVKQIDHAFQSVIEAFP